MLPSEKVPRNLNSSHLHRCEPGEGVRKLVPGCKCMSHEYETERDRSLASSFVVATRFPDQNVKELRFSHSSRGGGGEDTALFIRYQLACVSLVTAR